MRKIFYKKTLVYVTILILIAAMLPMVSFNTVADPVPNEKPAFQDDNWYVKGSGNYFEIINSPYLDIVLQSSENIDIYMESIPRIIDITIYENNLATSTQLTISGFEINKEYYHYDNDALLTIFKTNNEGCYTFIQDLSEIHHVMIKEGPSTVYIKSDGSIDPITAPISVFGDTYKLTGDIFDELVIQKSGIILDGQGYTVQGTGINYGVYIEDGINVISDVTIKNVNINGFYDGIRCYRGYNINIENNNLDQNIVSIRLLESNNCIVKNNVVLSLGYGLYVYLGDGGHMIKGNTFFVYDYTVYLDPYYYYTRGIYFSGSGFMNTIDNNVIIGAQTGILIAYDEKIVISNNDLSGCDDNIWLTYCSGSVIIGNIVDGLGSSYGIGTGSDSINILIANNVIDGPLYGLDFYYTTDNFVTGNIVKNCFEGLDFMYCEDFTFTLNNFEYNTYCLAMWYCYNNDFYYNSFIDNYINLYSLDSSHNWDDGYGKGNYWSDYIGLDDGSNGRTAGDGVGDTDIPHPYVGIPSIGYYQLDNYPLMTQYITINIDIDIKPGSYPNTIQTKSKGQTPVAILCTDTFSPYVVDPSTISFLGANPVHCAMQDVDNDGDVDMILQFETQELNFNLVVDEGDEYPYAYLNGETLSGVFVVGKDTVNLKGPNTIFSWIINRFPVLGQLLNLFPFLEKILNQIV